MPVSSLRRPSFTRFWLGETATVLAYQMLVVAIGWQTYELTDSALSLGLIGLVQFTPQFLLTLPAGHVADRYDRRRIALVCQTIQFVIAVMLAVASFTGALSTFLIYAGSFSMGIAQAFQSPSIRSLLPALVERSELPRCIAWSGAARKIAVIAGPGVGGLIYLLGGGYVYATSALFFIVAGALITSVRVPNSVRPHEPVTLETVLGGITYIRRNPVVLGAISLDLFATLLGGTTALLPIFARDILETGPWGLGVLRSAPAIGALIVSVAFVRTPLNHNVGRTMYACVAVFGVATIVFGLSRSFALSLVALIVLGAADMISVVIRTSLIQLETPDQMRGRVTAVNSLFTSTSNQLGQFESGVTAALFGTVPAVVIGGIGTLLVAGIWIRMFPALYQRDVLSVRR
ncbi:MAG TPA: MFS transporter [Burkholderiales bacterium]|nr:MFS transporter [Burkholderiales bacterium]